MSVLKRNGQGKEMIKFTTQTHTCKTITASPTDEFICRAWEILCKDHYKPMSPNAIRAFLKISTETIICDLSSNVAFEIDMPAELASTGAVLFPNEFQPWESDDVSIVEPRCDDGSFTLTYLGEILKDKIMKEITKHYDIFLDENKTNKHQILLAI